MPADRNRPRVFAIPSPNRLGGARFFHRKTRRHEGSGSQNFGVRSSRIREVTLAEALDLARGATQENFASSRLPVASKKASVGTTHAVLPRRIMRLLAGLFLALIVLLPGTARADKVRDLVDIVGARENQLVGYGVVTGLNGTGDDVSSPFATQSLRALLRRLGVQVDARQIRLKNVAAVIVTANIPPFARNGSKLDIVVSSMGNAKSLRGGVLIQTPLRGADRKTYAVGRLGQLDSGERDHHRAHPERRADRA